MLTAKIKEIIETALIDSRETRGAMTMAEWEGWQADCNAALAAIEQEDGTGWEPVSEDERVEICESHFNREAGDDACRFIPVWLSSTAIMFDNDSTIEIPDTHEIVRRVAQAQPTQEDDHAEQ